MMRLNALRVFLLTTICVATFTACEDDGSNDLSGNWVELSDFEGFRRSSAVSFAVGEFAYVGTGFNGDEDEYYRDFWRYDANQNFWQRIDSLPGVGRSAAVGFSIGETGYVGLGFDGDDELRDFYRYDPAGEWTRIADFGGTARRSAVAFGLNGKGYVGTGDDGNTLKDFWEYDPEADTWTQLPSIGGSKRESAVAFVIGDFAYVGTGADNGSLEFDFWRFDPMLLPDFPWVALADLDDDDDYAIARESAVAFATNGRGYVVSGLQGSVTSSVWEYIPADDLWEEKTALEGVARRDAVAFTVNERGFVATGRSGSSYFDDIWEFAPNETEDEDD